jgi:hypothetical protein
MFVGFPVHHPLYGATIDIGAKLINDGCLAIVDQHVAGFMEMKEPMIGILLNQYNGMA